jgi:hypothetical protein
MLRIARVAPKGLIYHILARGNKSSEERRIIGDILRHFRGTKERYKF